MNNERLIKLGLNVKVARLQKGLSQEQLAEKINTSRNTISMIETAKQHPTVLKIYDIAKALNVDLNILFRDID